jgi:hypothetical protein
MDADMAASGLRLMVVGGAGGIKYVKFGRGCFERWFG